MKLSLLTGHGSVESAIKAMKLGAYDYLTKPFHLPELEIHIEKAFEKVCLARRELPGGWNRFATSRRAIGWWARVL